MIPLSVHRFDSVTSTNDVALSLAKRGEPEGTVVVAQSQTAGRGRHGRTWVDEPGKSLLMSVVMKPRLPLERVHELSFVASLAVADYLKASFDLEPALKWPNDVLVRGRKITGILVETATTQAGLAAVVGVGVNVNQTAFPSPVGERATSIAIETGTHRVEAMVEPLARTLLGTCESLISGGFEEILNRWRKYMWGVGEETCVQGGEGVVQGIVLDVDASGALLLRDVSGQVNAVRAGGITAP